MRAIETLTSTPSVRWQQDELFVCCVAGDIDYHGALLQTKCAVGDLNGWQLPVTELRGPSYGSSCSPRFAAITQELKNRTVKILSVVHL